jgi:hypothetical protein
MSGLYNMLFGENHSQKGFLFGLLGKTEDDFGRYRDIYVTDEHIVVHTRNGGGTREDYQEVFDEMMLHPLYVCDDDDDYDCTYANFYFKHPKGFEDLLKEIAVGTVTPSEKWRMLLDALQQPPK